MKELKIIDHISMDGVIEAPGGPPEDGGCGCEEASEAVGQRFSKILSNPRRGTNEALAVH